ncbi:MAG TPA: hypothetical protein VK894_02350, partial [Jiangellales bacterium]|nr:hypothetical protein [Jiangellales bacterium]
MTWGPVPQRAQEIASALGGRACAIRPRRLGAAGLVPLRWLVSAVLTTVHLLRHRPAAVVVTNPPIALALTVYVLRPLLGARVVLDSHPGGFGVQGDRVAARVQWLHRHLARRARAVLVASEPWARTVRAWGGCPLVLHEAEPAWRLPPAAPLGDRARVLLVAVFGGDEPVASAVEAACGMRLDLRVTGDLRRAPRGLLG